MILVNTYDLLEGTQLPARLDEPRGARRSGGDGHGRGTNHPGEWQREPRRQADEPRRQADEPRREDRRPRQDSRGLPKEIQVPKDGRLTHGRRAAKKARWRRSALFPVVTVATVVVVAVAGLTVYRLGPGRPSTSGLSATFDVIGNSKAIAALEAERQQILEMDAATRVLTGSAKPLMASVSQANANNSSSTSGGTVVWTTPDPATAKLIAQELMPSYGFSVSSQWSCLDDLWTRESGWIYDAENVSSGAYGIPQSLPADKMAMFGADYLTDPTTQIKWGLWYIQNRYGTPCAAWNTELAEGAY